MFQALILAAICHMTLGQTVTFTDLADLPEARSAVTAANDGEHLYLANGWGGTQAISPDIFKYDIATDIWSILTSSSLHKRYASASFMNGKLYVFNGQLADQTLNPHVEIIDPVHGTITYGADNPQPVWKAGVSEWNGKIYSFGGAFLEFGNKSSKVYEYDPASDTWSEVAEMSLGVEAKGEIVDGKLYIIGGYVTTPTDRIQVYDLESGQWEPEIIMPVTVSAHATARLGSRIYIVGDYTNLEFLACLETMDNSFHILESNLNARRHSAAEGVDGVLYSMGGNTDPLIYSCIASVQAADVLSATEHYPVDHTLSVYPNHARDRLYVDGEFDAITITDLCGRVMIRKAGHGSNIDVSRLSPGSYLLFVERNGQWSACQWIRD